MVEVTNGSSESHKAPLEELMVAMDVVDTLRHDQSIAERELDGESRRERLLERLRGMYSAQGIDVPDHVLQEGIDALEQERFKYQPIASSWRTKLAHLWVGRGRWGKPLGFLAVVASAFWGVYFVTDVLPEWNLRAELPKQLSEIKDIAKNPEIIARAESYVRSANQALEDQNLPEAQSILKSMQSVSKQLQSDYSIRVVSGERSAVYRIPPNNPNGRNYYLIVEAVDKNNKVLELPINNQENNTMTFKKSWGLRVSEETFLKMKVDKEDDGIIQDNTVGEKAIGYLEPQFTIPTTGATITEW